MPLPSLRAAVVGARRRRQGTGEFVAREMHAQGIEVCSIVGTRRQTVEEARRTLAESHGIHARGYTSLQDLLEHEQVDLVAVCSPPDVHVQQVERAVDAGCHVLCEKPLWWGPSASEATDVGERAGALVDRCIERGRYLALNAQWPYTLGAYRELHPDAYGDDRPVESFSMRLSPTATGAQGVADSGSHLLSMLYALLGPGALEALCVTRHDPSGADLELSFRYRHSAGAAQASLRLVQCLEPPRPAGYEINGKSVLREVELAPYRISFRAQGRTVLLKDPTALSVADFVAGVRAGRSPDRQALVAGMTQLQELARAAEQNPR